MKLVYLDCVSGISGDMLLASLLDLGWPKEDLLELPGILNLQDARIEIKEVSRHGLRAVKVDIACPSTQPFRNMEDLTSLINRSSLPEDIRKSSLDILRRIAEAEAKIHSCSVNEVHFHEIGAVDTVIDITGVLLALKALAVSRVLSSPLPVSRGFTDSSHGPIPLPAPAALELLENIPVYSADEKAELVTPTGAAIISRISDSFGPIPEMKIIRTGYGAGARELKSMPNILRTIMGEPGILDFKADTVSEISTVIDDMTPEQLGALLDKVFQEGALDAWITSVHMKKNRSGFEFTLLCRPHQERALAQCLLVESSSIGVRIRHSRRWLLAREQVSIMTSWGPIDAKRIVRPGGLEEIVPEFDSCSRVAARFGIPLRMVYSEAVKAGAGWKRP